MKKILPILVLVAISLELGLIALAAEDAGGELSGVQQTEAVSGQGEAAAAADETAPSPAGDASPVSPTDITSEGTVSPTNLMVYCVVTYNPNGGTLASGTSSTSTVAYRYAYGAMPAASRIGYTFAGWWTQAAGGEQRTDASRVPTTSNHTLYAHWTANSYTVCYDPNGGFLGAGYSASAVSYGAAYGNSMPTAVRIGYTNEGWWTEADGGSRVYAETPLDVASDRTLYAHWTLKTGWDRYNGVWYYMKDSAVLAANEIYSVGGTSYGFDASCRMLTGWQTIGGSRYYFAGSGAMRTGWLKIGSNWYYLESDGKMCTGLRTIGGAVYYLGTDGAMATGWMWIQQGEVFYWYYFSGSGAMQTNRWLKSGSSWYYVGGDGKMCTGFQTIGGAVYYLGTGGRMVTGWQRVPAGGDYYYFSGSGAMKTGWVKYGDGWYYLDTDGRMLANTARVIGGVAYTFGSGGRASW